jgi:hypothetical protein
MQALERACYAIKFVKGKIALMVWANSRERPLWVDCGPFLRAEIAKDWPLSVYETRSIHTGAWLEFQRRIEGNPAHMETLIWTVNT